MKRMHNPILTAAALLRRCPLPAAAALLLAACAHDDALPGYPGGEGGLPVRFSASMQAAPPQAQSAAASDTRTADDDRGGTVWTAGDAAGIFMLSSGGTIPGDLVPGADNVEFTVDPATGTLAPRGASIYYPLKEVAVDFVACHPFIPGMGQGDAPYTISVPLLCDQTSAEKQAALDVLLSDNAQGILSRTEAVDLRFRHLLSKIRLDITLTPALEGQSVMGAAFHGMACGVAFAMDGSIVEVEPPHQEKPIAALLRDPAATGTVACCTALVVPQQDDTARTITVTVGGKEYTGKIPDADRFEANTLYIYPVTVGPTGITVGTHAIAGWGTNDHGSQEAVYVEE